MVQDRRQDVVFHNGAIGLIDEAKIPADNSSNLRPPHGSCLTVELSGARAGV